MFGWFKRLFCRRRIDLKDTSQRFTDDEIVVLAIKACQLVALECRVFTYNEFEIADACNKAMHKFVQGNRFNSKQLALANRTIRQHILMFMSGKLI